MGDGDPVAQWALQAADFATSALGVWAPDDEGYGGARFRRLSAAEGFLPSTVPLGAWFVIFFFVAFFTSIALCLPIGWYCIVHRALKNAPKKKSHKDIEPLLCVVVPETQPEPEPVATQAVEPDYIVVDMEGEDDASRRGPRASSAPVRQSRRSRARSVRTVEGVDAGYHSDGDKEVLGVGEERPVIIKIIKARGLRKADWGPGTSDPYCVCQVPGKEDTKVETPTLPGTVNPVWNFEETMVNYQVGQALEFTLWDDDYFKDDDFLGRAWLSPKKVQNGFEGELKLTGPLAEGFLTVKVTLKPREGAQARKEKGWKGQADGESRDSTTTGSSSFRQGKRANTFRAIEGEASALDAFAEVGARRTEERTVAEPLDDLDLKLELALEAAEQEENAGAAQAPSPSEVAEPTPTTAAGSPASLRPKASKASGSSSRTPSRPKASKASAGSGASRGGAAAGPPSPAGNGQTRVLLFPNAGPQSPPSGKLRVGSKGSIKKSDKKSTKSTGSGGSVQSPRRAAEPDDQGSRRKEKLMKAASNVPLKDAVAVPDPS